MVTPMTDTKTDVHLDPAASSLRLRRHFNSRPTQIWAAIIDNELMSIWFPTAVTIEPEVGGRMTFSFPGGEPEIGIVVEFESERRLAFEGGGVGVEITLQPASAGTDLVFTTGVPDIQHAASLAAGYDLCLGQLDVLLTHGPSSVQRTEMPPPQDLVLRYASEYGLPTDIKTDEPSNLEKNP